MNRETFRWYAAFYRGSQARLILGAGLSFLRALALLPIPLLVAVAIDDAAAVSAGTARYGRRCREIPNIKTVDWNRKQSPQSYNWNNQTPETSSR